MKILAIESATPASSVALGEGRVVVAMAERVDRSGHSAFLVSAIDFLFDQAGWTPEQLDAIVVDVGPGLYTGIRVGMATAQGMAAALGIPVIPGNSPSMPWRCGPPPAGATSGRWSTCGEANSQSRRTGRCLAAS